jgi:hypothetical protein
MEMTEEEYKFLEVIYNRGSIPVQSYINFVSKSRSGDAAVAEDESIGNIFSRFRDSGLINTNNRGIYQITPLGKEKFEELCERKTSRELVNPGKKSKPFHFGRRVWLAIVILTIIVSVVTSTVIERWDFLMELLRRFKP